MAAKNYPITDAVGEVQLRTDDFTPEGESESIHYVRLVINVKVNGVDKEISLKPSRDQLLVLSLADTDTDLTEL